MEIVAKGGGGMNSAPRWLKELARAKVNSLKAAGEHFGNWQAVDAEIERIKRDTAMAEDGMCTAFEAGRIILKED